jgi:hypothetical protein
MDQTGIEYGVPSQVMDVLRDVLVELMDAPDSHPHDRIMRAMYIGRNSGQILSGEDILAGRDTPSGLRLLMRSGAEYDLLLKQTHIPSGVDE